jgi:hypothetical protein
VPTNLASARNLLGWRVNQWLSWGTARPWMVWGKGPELKMSGGAIDLSSGAGHLLGVIAWSLAMAVCGNAIAFCKDCMKPYVPSRRVAAGRNNFCPACRLRGPQKLSNRKTRDVARRTGAAANKRGGPDE